MAIKPYDETAQGVYRISGTRNTTNQGRICLELNNFPLFLFKLEVTFNIFHIMSASSDHTQIYNSISIKSLKIRAQSGLVNLKNMNPDTEFYSSVRGIIRRYQNTVGPYQGQHSNSNY